VKNDVLGASRDFTDTFIGFAAGMIEKAENSATRCSTVSSADLLKQVKTASNER